MDSKLLIDMFHLGLPWLEKVIRPVLVYDELMRRLDEMSRTLAGLKSALSNS